MPAVVTQAQLERIIRDYDGVLLDKKQLTPYQLISFKYFTAPRLTADPRAQYTVQLDITSIYSNFEKNYRTTPDATFAVFIKWIAIKAMHGTPFNWRYINGEWYEFKNLPLEIAIATNDERKKVRYFLNDVCNDSWETFCKRHNALFSGALPGALQRMDDLPLYAIALKISAAQAPMGNDATKNEFENLDHPRIVFGSCYQQENFWFLSFDISFSYATLKHELVEDFLHKFIFCAKLKPAFVEIMALLLENKNSKEMEPSFYRKQPSFTPGLYTQNHQQQIKPSLEVITDLSKNQPRAKL